MNFIMLVAVGLVSGFCTYRLLTWASQPKIVAFKDGTYGVRKFTVIGFQFLDLEDDEPYWWMRHNRFEKYYKGGANAAQAAFDNLANNSGTPDKGEVAK